MKWPGDLSLQLIGHLGPECTKPTVQMMELPPSDHSLLAALEAISPDSISDLSDKELSELLKVRCRGGTRAAQQAHPLELQSSHAPLDMGHADWHC